MIVVVAISSVLIALSAAKPSPQAGLCPNGLPYNIIPDTPGNVDINVRQPNFVSYKMFQITLKFYLFFGTVVVIFL